MSMQEEVRALWVSTKERVASFHEEAGYEKIVFADAHHFLAYIQKLSVAALTGNGFPLGKKFPYDFVGKYCFAALKAAVRNTYIRQQQHTAMLKARVRIKSLFDGGEGYCKVGLKGVNRYFSRIAVAAAGNVD